MTTTPIAGATHMDPAAVGQVVIGNEMVDTVEQAALGFLQITLPDSDYTLVGDELQYWTLQFLGTLSAPRTITVPATTRPYDIRNDSGQTLTISPPTNSPAGATVAIEDGAEQIVRCDGFDVLAVTAPTVGGAVSIALDDLTDVNVSGSPAPADGDVLTYNGVYWTHEAPASPVAETVVALTDGPTPALDASLGNIFTLTAAGDRTIAVPSNPTSGQKIIIRHLASGGARTLSLNTGAGGFRFGADITALTATESGKTDYVGCIYNAADSKWDVVAVSKGYL